jgi:pimeloyl-ACP methyl ester carboxylesterase
LPARPSALRALLALLTTLLAVFGLRGGRRRTSSGPEGPLVVTADDGAPLHVEIDEAPGAALTVVMVHGFTANMNEFSLQRETLRGRARVVLYDQRGHGRSGWGNVRNATFDQLGRDLTAVLDRHAATGPVVLLGHSMGGMTIMALARQRPELFADRVKGVFLLATAAGDLVTGGVIGLVARLGKRLHLLPIWLWWLRVNAPLIERFRKRGTRLGYAYIRHYLFGRDDARPDLVRLVQDLLEETPLTITSAFYPSFLEHDETAALPVLRAVPVTVLCGDSDRLTPVRHSRRMAEEIGAGAELVVVPGAGHSVNITRQEVVDEALLRLLDRAAPAAVSA